MHAEFFHDCFTQTVKLAMELKLTSLGHISLDGSKFKANSSKHTKAALEIRESALHPEKAIDDKKRPSDHRWPTPEPKCEDKQELKPALEQVGAAAGKLPDKLSADNGYLSGDNLEALGGHPVDAYIATDKGEKTAKIPLSESERKLIKADFDYHVAGNHFTCPGEQRLEMNRKMETDVAKTVYKERKVIVEPVFGQIKNSGFRGFSVCGKEKAEGEFSLVCAVHNIKKIAKAMIRGVICPEYGKWAENNGI